MKLQADFSFSDFERITLDGIERRERALLNAYIQAGEEFIRMARTKTKAENGFGDITGNLRSSIGYLVTLRGQTYSQRFEEGGNGTDQKTGVQVGRDYAAQISNDTRGDIVLIVVAGMDYAQAVEFNSRDVITGSSLLMEGRLKELIKLSI